MSRFILPVAALVAAFFIASAPSPAGTVISDDCLPRQLFADTIAKRYGERIVALGVAGAGIFKGMLIERWESPGGKSWTLTATFPNDNVLCVVASGEFWSKKRPPPVKPTGLPL